MDIPYTAAEFKQMYLEMPISKLQEITGLSRYHINIYAGIVGLPKKKAGRPVEKYNYKEEENENKTENNS